MSVSLAELGIRIGPTSRQRDLDNTRYTIEQSKFTEVAAHLPSVGGKNLQEWIQYCSLGGSFNVFEIGGGVCQTTAKEILARHGDHITHYSAFEPRRLTPETKSSLHPLNNFHHIRVPIEDITALEKCYTIGFSHRVFEHLENPLAVLKTACDMLVNGGVFLCNGTLLDRGLLSRLFSLFQNQGVEFACTDSGTEGALIKAGLVRASFGIMVCEGLRFPEVKIGDYLHDYQGRRLATRKLELQH